MAKKYDTNPLDPEFPERARATAAASSTAPQTPFKTNEFPVSAPSSSITEEETRRFSEADFNAYSFHGADAPLAYQAPRFADMNAASSRKVGKVGMPEKWLIGLPYLPFYIGLVAGVVLLLVVRHGLVYGPAPFSATLEELGRDAELLERVRDAQGDDDSAARRREEA